MWFYASFNDELFFQPTNQYIEIPECTENRMKRHTSFIRFHKHEIVNNLFLTGM